MAELGPLDTPPCPECRQHTLVLEMALKPREIGTFSLAGMQMKFSASEWPRIRCTSCGVSAWANAVEDQAG